MSKKLYYYKSIKTVKKLAPWAIRFEVLPGRGILAIGEVPESEKKLGSWWGE